MITSDFSGQNLIPKFDITNRFNDLWARDIENLMRAQDPKYLIYFTPFTANSRNIYKVLNKSICCLIYKYLSEKYDNICIGTWFLMGWENQKPEFGILIDENHSNQGIGTLSLQIAILTARWNNAKSIKYVTWPENINSTKIHQKFNFKSIELRDNGQILWELNL